MSSESPRNRIWLFFAGLMTAASLATGGEFDAAAAEQRVQEMAERLDLSDQQLEQLQPLVTESIARQLDVLEVYGINPDGVGAGRQSLGMRQVMAMRKDMMAVREELRDGAAKILSDEQMQEFQAIQEERAAVMRERILAGRQR